MGQQRLRVAVIGVGHLGEYHVQKYRGIPGVELVGVVDMNLDRVNEIARRYHTKAYGHHRDILDMVDAVSLAVTTEMHFQVARDILQQGVHMLIEKPITYDLTEADDLISMARDRGLILQVGLVERFNPAIVKMEGLLKSPVFIEAHRMNLFTKRGLDVDVVLDLMIHDLDIILHIVPSEVREIHAVGMPVITDKTDIASVRLVFENGTAANLTASRVSGKMLRKIRVFQPDAYISADCGKRQLTVINLDTERKDSDDFPQVSTSKEKFEGTDPLNDEISSFVRSVIDGSEPVVTGEDGRNALRVALSIIEQIETGSKNFDLCG
ncbi:MAG: Gfo/Idh/MocA family oxidoreductase [Deltaproteobacteria bacterium]|nr:Gfo/Idh/MocA family oxidoreductase [Deltaproteobacteria bacterium]MBW2047043.1 Gfo/Idh/MocA family oxidoreductase [Deltaproteobacteria bacterium]MBW2110053.1 Gfo/Idh/MocA family oxidoreductase [Deltaproteobacteria bacterium]MBW2353266.1 Gfo/Idh/MocA family oxidoreductase [Deltaproteobacteria bacterium]